MAFSRTITGATDRSSIVRGDVGIVSGTWSSGTDASGTIATGGSVVLAHGVTIGSASVVSGTTKVIFSEKNKTGNGDTRNGVIRVTAMDPSNELTGDWWAIVTV